VPGPGEDPLTIDELSAATGLSVRTTRYYASLGLLPAPIRRGRVAYYSSEHRARLELVRALQDHGFTLAAIERYMTRIPPDASLEDLAVQRAMLTSWSPGRREQLTVRQLEKKAGRTLDRVQLERLRTTGAVARTDDDRYEVLPAFDVGLQLLDMDVSLDSIAAASAAITRHMDALADELTEILRATVIEPYRRSRHTDADAARFEQTMSRLRRLTLEAVVSGFQQAANQVITRSLTRR
jgi:DNA-binding transcriptional MerR regulator